MEYKNLDDLILSRDGWTLHVANGDNDVMVMFVIHSRAHPSETRRADLEFTKIMTDVVDEDLLGCVAGYHLEHPKCPFVAYCTSIAQGIEVINFSIARANEENIFHTELVEWKNFLNRMI